MVWFFERGIEMAVVEVRRREKQYEFALRLADGDEQVDVLPTPRELFALLERVPNTLFIQGWRPVSGLSTMAIEGASEQS
jgi:hypothetical protein